MNGHFYCLHAAFFDSLYFPIVSSNAEVYIDEGKKTYQDLGYRRFNFINIWKALLSRISRTAMSESRSRNVSGNLSGDGLQNGGLLIVTRYGTRVLLNHHEEVPGDHASNEQILEALGISKVAEDPDKP